MHSEYFEALTVQTTKNTILSYILTIFYTFPAWHTESSRSRYRIYLDQDKFTALSSSIPMADHMTLVSIAPRKLAGMFCPREAKERPGCTRAGRLVGESCRQCPLWIRCLCTSSSADGSVQKWLAVLALVYSKAQGPTMGTEDQICSSKPRQWKLSWTLNIH